MSCSCTAPPDVPSVCTKYNVDVSDAVAHASTALGSRLPTTVPVKA